MAVKKFLDQDISGDALAEFKSEVFDLSLTLKKRKKKTNCLMEKKMSLVYSSSDEIHLHYWFEIIDG